MAVSGLAIDSRQVRPGDLFFALPGSRARGWVFIAEAVRRGAVAVVTHPFGRQAACDAGVPAVLTTAPGRLMALMASRFFDEPSRKLVLVGITGTNGKTTVSFLLEAIFKRAGHKSGIIGTISYRGGAAEQTASLTTPPAPELQALLASMRNGGVTHVAMEVSSHALALDRVGCCHWNAAVFTNLGRDHLDFHGELDSYFAAKSRLVTEGLAASEKSGKFAVINIDDPWGRRLVSVWAGRTITFGSGTESRTREHVTVHGVELGLQGTSGILALGSDEIPFHSSLVGSGHLANVMASAAVAWGLGIAPEAIAQGIADLTCVPGRLEAIEEGQAFKVFVDYAHTPDALTSVLSSLRPQAARLLTVFGCGGDRDQGKRPLMGRAAAQYSDLIFLTSDNPRTEEPEKIIWEVEPGLREAGALQRGGSELERFFSSGQAASSQGTSYWVLPERREAIEAALRAARPGDVVLIAGKGHEDYQIIGQRRFPFDDREVARQVLRSIYRLQ